MSEKEKEIIKNISDAIPKLDAAGRNYILGMAEGMIVSKQLANSEAIGTVQTGKK